MANEQLPIFSDLQQEIARQRRAGNRNYVLAYTLYWLNIVSGMLAAILAAVGTKVLVASYPNVAWNFVVAALAAFPVASSSALSVFRVREKVDWYWSGKEKVEVLFRQLRDDPSANPTEVSNKLSELKLKLRESFPGFGGKSGK